MYRELKGVTYTMSKLHIFDMDGTLLDGSACLHISEYLGKLDAVNVIEEAWGRGDVGHVAFYELCLPLWEGLSDSDVDQIFKDAPWFNGISAVLEDIAQRGEYSAVISLSPQFFVDRLLSLGLGSAHGAKVYAGLQPVPEHVLTPDSKVQITMELMERYNLRDIDCVAYGDSASDVPLFQFLPNTVAVNGTESLLEFAKSKYDGVEMLEAYSNGRKLLSASSC